MDQFQQLKKFITVPTNTGYISNVINYWKLDGTIANEILGGNDIGFSGVVEYTSSGIPPVGNTVWSSGAFITNAGPGGQNQKRLYYTYPGNFTTAGEVSAYMYISDEIAIQTLFQLTSFSYLYTAETLTGVFLTYRDTNGVQHSQLNGNYLPRNQTFKLRVKWDSSVPCTVFYADNAVMYSGNNTVDMGAVNGYSLHFGSLNDGTRGLTPRSRIGQIYFSGYMNANTQYLSGILSGYAFNIYDNAGNLYPQFVNSIVNGVGNFSGTSPAGLYVLEYNDYVAAKHRFPSGIGNTNSLVIV